MQEYTIEQCVEMLKLNKLLEKCVSAMARNGRISAVNLAFRNHMKENEIEEFLEKNAYLGLYTKTDFGKVHFKRDVDLYELTDKGGKTFNLFKGLDENVPEITLINFLYYFTVANGEVILYPQKKKYKVMDLIYDTPEELDLSAKVHLINSYEYVDCAIIETE